ncbi:hypothetical protein [Cupriavidus campinensis]
MTKERPILFSGAMVRAILDGRKTQTRRVVKRQPYVSVSNPPHYSDVEAGDVFVCPDFAPTTSVRGSVLAECERPGVYRCMGQKQFAEKHSPYGVPGDRLWVRETWAQPAALDPGPTVYRADYPACVPTDFENIPPAAAIRWKPSIHMPRAACRIKLEITGVRVERLNDCREADAVAEGLWRDEEVPFNGPWFASADSHEGHSDPRDAYRQLWDSINGDGAWEANPWVWVVAFRRLA